MPSFRFQSFNYNIFSNTYCVLLGTSPTKRCKGQARGWHHYKEQVSSPHDTCRHGRKADVCGVPFRPVQRKWWVEMFGPPRHLLIVDWLIRAHQYFYVTSHPCVCCSGQPVEVHRLWECCRTPRGSRTSCRWKRRDPVLWRWRFWHRGVQVCQTYVSALLST